MKKNGLIILFLLIVQQSYSQFQGSVYVPNNGAVEANAQNMLAPWIGGINSIQITKGDLNNDGKEDLVLFDHHNLVLHTLINEGGVGTIQYKNEPKYKKNFPYVRDYVILKDYNCDNIPDLFHHGNLGMDVYKGFYDNNELKFTFYKNLTFPATNGPIPVYVQPSDIPTIADMDNDGDLDALGFNVPGNILIYYKNMQVEMGLPCDSIVMKLGSNCWGHFFQNFNREVSLGYSCFTPLAPPSYNAEKKYRHTGNCHTHFDIDGDGDMDMVDGNVSFTDLQVLYNNGQDSIIAQDTLFQTGGHVLHMPSWLAPFHVDIDNDGDGDLLVTSHNENLSSADYNVINYYKNIGSNSAPNFVYQNDSLLINEVIDLGSYSYPTFFDYNKDGKKDLFVGSEGRLNNQTGTRVCKVAYYLNTSTPGNISFQLITDDFLQLSQIPHQGIFPNFGDITGDGIDDFIFGGIQGGITVYKNAASSNLVTPNFLFYIDSLAGIAVDAYSAPFLADVTEDGKTDLLIGSQSGKISLFVDTSTTSIKKLAIATNSYGNIKVGNPSEIYGHAVPYIAKVDNLQIDYLCLGNIDGIIERYDSFKNSFNTFYKMDSMYSSIKATTRSAPAIADIDGDGRYDMVVGNKLGGLLLYRQDKLVVGLSEVNQVEESFKVFPNPTKQDLYIQFEPTMAAQEVTVKLLELNGRVVSQQKINTENVSPIQVSHLSQGMYLLQVELQNKKVLKKIMKL
ncbi:MAG: T9SS type A sorting domain-containing protein [Chitinophagaceae bacterium]